MKSPKEQHPEIVLKTDREMLLDGLYLQYNSITSISDTNPQRVHLFINLHVLFELLLNVDPWFCSFPFIVEIFMTEIHEILLHAFDFS